MCVFDQQQHRYLARQRMQQVDRRLQHQGFVLLRIQVGGQPPTVGRTHQAQKATERGRRQRHLGQRQLFQLLTALLW